MSVKTVFDETKNGKRVVIGEKSDSVGALAFILAIFKGGQRIHTSEYGTGDSRPPHNHTLDSVKKIASKKAA